MPNIPAKEPVLSATVVAPFLVFAAAKFGFALTTEDAGIIAAFVLAVGAALARRFVWAAPNHEEAIYETKRRAYTMGAEDTRRELANVPTPIPRERAG